MAQILSCLDMNPRGETGKAKESLASRSPVNTNMLGKHCIMELYECDELKLNDEAYLRTIVSMAAKLAGATLLRLITHKFEPQGVTGLALLAESHISIHTWPENRYAAVDVFTCGDHTMPERACEVLMKELSSQRYALNSFKRAIPLNIKNSLREPSQINSL